MNSKKQTPRKYQKPEIVIYTFLTEEGFAGSYGPNKPEQSYESVNNPGNNWFDDPQNPFGSRF